MNFACWLLFVFLLLASFIVVDIIPPEWIHPDLTWRDVAAAGMGAIGGFFICYFGALFDEYQAKTKARARRQTTFWPDFEDLEDLRND